MIRHPRAIRSIIIAQHRKRAVHRVVHRGYSVMDNAETAEEPIALVVS
jgi:hypothetical protein